MIFLNHSFNPRPKDNPEDDQTLLKYLFQLRLGQLKLLCAHTEALIHGSFQSELCVCWVCSCRIPCYYNLWATQTPSVGSQNLLTPFHADRQFCSSKPKFPIHAYPSLHYLFSPICSISLAGNSEEIQIILKNKLCLIN